MRLCVECRFFATSASSLSSKPATRPGVPTIPQPGGSHLCMHPSTVSEIDPVDGETRRYTRNALAYNQRQYPHWMAIVVGRCGTRARFFEQEGE